MRTDDETVEKLAEELEHHEPMTLVLRPQTVLHLCGLVQLAQRHPQLGEPSQRIARLFVEQARAYFADCQTVLEVLRRGDDPREDR